MDSSFHDDTITIMDKVYDPQKYEREIYRKWEEGGAFKTENRKQKTENRER